MWKVHASFKIIEKSFSLTAILRKKMGGKKKKESLRFQISRVKRSNLKCKPDSSFFLHLGAINANDMKLQEHQLQSRTV